MDRLDRAGATQLVEALQRKEKALTSIQSARLSSILTILKDDGSFVLQDALNAGEIPSPVAFNEFVARTNAAAAKAGIELRLELESRKVTPTRRIGWFVGSDLNEAGLAQFSQATAERSAVTRPIAQSVVEVDASRHTRLYVSHDGSAKADRLLRLLEQTLLSEPGNRWLVTHSGSPSVGQTPSAVRDRYAMEADVRLALVSLDWLADTVERTRVWRSPCAAFASGQLPAGPIDVTPMLDHEIQSRGRPWESLTRSEDRQEFIDEVAYALRRALPDAQKQISALSKQAAERRRPGESAEFIAAAMAETKISESGLDASDEESKRLDGVARLVAWANDPGAPRLCALLGDVGMGKTTATKMFTQHVLEARARGETAPLPILFDLRDVDVEEIRPGITLERILTSLLNANQPPGEHLSADDVRLRLIRPGAVIIFDGLDEVLVHLSPKERSRFTQQLWRAAEPGTGTKMLLTCRTQFFRTIRDEITHFSQEGREKVRGSDYLALLMLPFEADQIREYLAANLARTTAEVDDFLDMISTVHNLPDLARRPMTLRLIADQVAYIEAARRAGRPVRAVDLYREFTERWLSRDDEKHTLRPRHKQLLMEEIAAEQWRTGENSWMADQVDDWLHALLRRRDDLRLQYRDPLPDLWEADLRTATFLSRTDDRFAFAHRSLGEYFLSQYLFRALEDGDTARAWAMPVPSQETLDFLGMTIAGRPEAALVALETAKRIYEPQVSELALAYAMHAAQCGYPHHTLTGARLPGARLDGWSFDASTPPLSGIDLRGASLREATFRSVDLNGADLGGADITRAEFYDCDLRSVGLDGTLALSPLMRHCELEGTELALARARHGRLLFCSGVQSDADGWLVAPDPGRVEALDAVLSVQNGHFGTTNAVAYSPDGTTLATAGDDGTVRIWDIVSEQATHTLTGHTSWVTSVAYSPDGTTLATAGRDRTVRIWDTETGRTKHTLTGHTDTVRVLAYAPDGTALATAGNDHRVRLWDVDSGQITRTFKGHTNWVRTLAYSPDGTTVATGSDDQTVRIWDPTTGKSLRTLRGHTKLLRAVAYSPDGESLATAGDDTILIWNIRTGRTTLTLAGHTNRVTSVAYSPDGTALATAGHDRTVRIWDARSGLIAHTLTGHTGSVMSLAYAPDSSSIATAGNDHTIQIWDVRADGHTTQTLTGHTDSVRAVAFSPDGTTIATATATGDVIHVWDTRTGRATQTLSGFSDSVRAVAYSPDGTTLATAGDDNTVRIWNARSGQVNSLLAGHTSAVTAVVYSPDGATLATAEDGVIRIWETHTGRAIHTFTGPSGIVTALAYSPDGTTIATAADDRTIRISNAVNGRAIHQFTGLGDTVTSIAYSPDGAIIATGGGDRIIRLWDARSGLVTRTLAGHRASVKIVAYAPDGTSLATVGDDRAVRIWDPHTGNVKQVLTGFQGEVNTLAYTPDGVAVAIGDDASLQIRAVTTGEAVGFETYVLPDAGWVSVDAAHRRVVAATENAWRWIVWNIVEDGRLVGLPAETFGALPEL